MIKTIVFLLIFTTSLLADDCVKIKAAFDIGSGTTKLKVAKVNTCLQKIVKILLEKNMPVGYKEALKSGNAFSAEIRKKGLNALKTLKEAAAIYKPVSYMAVATSSFRDSLNSREFIEEIGDKLDIKVKVISQKVEAKLGFAAALAKSKLEADKLITWDIGGGSMQIISYSKTDGFSIYAGKMASITFKDAIVSKIQKHSVLENTSPNPISENQLLKALKIAKEEATHVSTKIKNKLKMGAKVIGIGGVHYYSIRKQIKNKTKKFSFAELTRTALERTGFSDKRIGGKYAATEISNLALVLGFMDSLGIKEVSTEKINMADGILIAPESYYI